MLTRCRNVSEGGAYIAGLENTTPTCKSSVFSIATAALYTDGKVANAAAALMPALFTARTDFGVVIMRASRQQLPTQLSEQRRRR